MARWARRGCASAEPASISPPASCIGPSRPLTARRSAVLPLRWDQGLPVVSLALGTRAADEFVFDTGNAGAMLLFARRAESLLAAAPPLPETAVRELGGVVRRAWHGWSACAPGWVARQVPAALETGSAARRGLHFDRLAGSLGVALFEPGAVTLDGPGGRLVVELPGLPEPPPLPGGFGFRLQAGHALAVSAVFDGAGRRGRPGGR